MKNGILNILAVGDVVGINGTEFIRKNLWNIRNKFEVDFAIVNGENSAKGNGIDISSSESIFSSGADVITTGNHVFRKHEIKDYISNKEYLLRPANYPVCVPGNGYCIFDTFNVKILVMSLLGTVYMESLDSPFYAAERILEKEKGAYELAIADFHAEATSEKIAFAKHFDGRINIVFGTHTHVPTADEKILKGGTGYITDLGMTGPSDSILGVKNEAVIDKFLTKMPPHFDEADGESCFGSALFSVDLATKKVLKVKRISDKEL